MNSIYDDLSPIIECIDEIKNNPSDTNKVKFTVKGDPMR